MTPGSPERRLVLGLWGLGGGLKLAGGPAGYGDVPEKAFWDVCDAAAAAGIEWIDVAPGYGGGEALRRLRHWSVERQITFKVGLKIGRPHENGRPVSRLEVDNLAAEFEAAVMELGAVPVAVMLKDPPPEFLCAPDLADRLDRIDIRLGIASIGITTHNVEIPAWTAPGGGRLLQLEFNGVQWRRARGLASAAHRRGWTVWGMQPLAYGFLAGHSASDRFADDDFRAYLPLRVKQGLASLSRYFHRTFDDLHDWSLAERALAFCLCVPAIDQVVIGPKTAAQLRSAVRAVALARLPDFAERVQALLAGTSHGSE